MFQKTHIEKFLSLNGVEPSAPDDQIKSVLLSAQWHEDDVEAAILVLRENPLDHKTHVDSIHKVFRSDERMKPETISALLGIEMDVKPADLTSQKRSNRNFVTLQLLFIVVFSLLLATGFLIASMYLLEMGPFHRTVL
ncbi:MAG: hypothetical protein ACI9H6_000701 [Patiriisocius sp.]|jgi:hypothetical protein